MDETDARPCGRAECSAVGGGKSGSHPAPVSRLKGRAGTRGSYIRDRHADKGWRGGGEREREEEREGEKAGEGDREREDKEGWDLGATDVNARREHHENGDDSSDNAVVHARTHAPTRTLAVH